MALEKQRMYRKNIDGTKDLLYRETSADIVKYKDSNVEAKLNELDSFRINGGAIGGNININSSMDIGTQDSAIDKIETSKSCLNIRTLNGKGTQLFIDNDSVRPSTEQPKKINLGIPTTPFKDLYIGDVSKTLKGYCTLPNGMLMQWGYANDGTQTQQINLSIPYSHNNYNVQVTPYTGTDVTGLNYKADAVNNGYFKITGTKTVAYYWMTIGW